MDITVDQNGIRRHPMFNNLIRVDLDLTGLCNRQCSFCPRSLDATPVYPNINKQMTLETVETVIKEMQSIDFGGWVELAGRGESTLHKKFETIVDMLTNTKRRWKVRLTTNGYKIDQWWNTAGNKLDELYLNSYESHEEYVERQELYKQLPNGNPVKHYYKQDGFTIKQVNGMPSYIEDGKRWKHAFNNRAGYFKDQDRRNAHLSYSDIVTLPNGKQIRISESPCWHPMRQIFIDFEGNYQMCCNDWLHQIKIGNIMEKSLMDMYVHDEKLNRIRWRLINRDRNPIAPCAKCDDIQGATVGTVRAVEKFKNSPAYREHVVPLAKLGRRFDKDLAEGK
ncbi:SPASM domain-containing protein [bacterium]|nr:SPASM domain-containing protein [bacterium]